MKDERIVYRVLKQQPHPNLAKHIDIAHDEGPYLWKYQTLSDFPKPAQATRILWYQDILRALVHLHRLGIIHSDIRVENILFLSQHHAILSDFGVCCCTGESNYYFRLPGEPVQLNGLAETKSEATDMFAMASAVYEIETGTRAEVFVDSDNALIIPTISTGHSGIDTMIRNAWLGHYDSTPQMLADAESLQDSTIRDSRGPIEYPVSDDDLGERVRQWREALLEQYGMNVPNILEELRL